MVENGLQVLVYILNTVIILNLILVLDYQRYSVSPHYLLTRGTFSDYHWPFGGLECIIGGFKSNEHQNGIFIFLVGAGNSTINKDTLGSRLSLFSH